VTVAAPLDGYRVIDLSSGIPGGYATKVLADAGADVIKVEAPEGDVLRRWSSSGAQIAPGDDGALFQYLAGSKSSVVVDPDGDLAPVRHLLSGADAAVWSRGSRLADLPALAPAGLRSAFPHLTVVAITPFGLDGPWAARPATEATVSALCGGPASYRGDVSFPPVLAGGRLTDWTGGMMAAVATLAARHRGLQTGVGELVDVSVLESAILTQTMYAVTFETTAGFPFRARRTATVPDIHPTADGFVGFMVVTGQQWLDFCVLVERPDWADDESLMKLTGRNARYGELRAAIDAWTSGRTTAEIVDFAVLLRVPVAPVGNGATVSGYDHFAESGFYVTNPRSGFRQPNVPYRLAGLPSPTLRPAPRLGEHTGGVPVRDAPFSVEPDPSRPVPQRPFEGLRVLEFTAFWAGPIVGNILGMLGADVIHVESAKRPDGMRFNTVKPMSEPGWWEWSPLFQGPNTDKRGLTLDLSSDRGRELARRLAAESDVVVENYSPRVMDEWGLSYESLRASNPSLIMVRMPAFGLSGPWRDRVGYAQTMEQVSGMAWVSGRADGPPVTLYGPADPIGGCHGLIGLLLALEHRRWTGEGTLVEAPQIGGVLSLAAEQVIEFSAYGALLHRTGNRSPWAAPQNTYLCADVDSDGLRDTWVVISVEHDQQWDALRAALGDPPWMKVPELDSAAGRHAAADAIDAELSAWCATRLASDVVAHLAAAGVPVAPVLPAHDAVRIEQLVHRRFFEPVTHSVTGESLHSGFPARFSFGPERLHQRPAPLLGQHNEEILAELLGLDEAEIKELARDGVIGTQVGGGHAW
jgi:crotonobetainyl-CoA:carnitine CoA-transferase CaiB-like acyl-CoA transferase